MTPDEIRDLQAQIKALNEGLGNIMQAVATLTHTVEQEHTRREEQTELILQGQQRQTALFVRVADSLDELSSGLPRIGAQLAEAAQELRAMVSKKKSRLAQVIG